MDGDDIAERVVFANEHDGETNAGEEATNMETRRRGTTYCECLRDGVESDAWDEPSLENS